MKKLIIVDKTSSPTSNNDTRYNIQFQQRSFAVLSMLDLGIVHVHVPLL